MRRVVLGAAVAAGLTFAVAMPAMAHHSYAGFDRHKTVTITGQIQHIEWKNPHIVLKVLTKDSELYTVLWHSASRLKRRVGAVEGVLKAGDPISVTGHPNVDADNHTMALITEVKRPTDGWRWWRPKHGKDQIEYGK